MQRGAYLIPAAILAMTISLAGRAAADDDDYPTWLPSSEAAVSVTGPVILFPDRFNAGQANFPWKEDSVVAQFKPDQGPIPARVFQVTQTTNPPLLNGAKLCGEKTVNWIVMVPVPPGGLEIDAYSVADKPSSASSPGLCATYVYKRW